MKQISRLRIFGFVYGFARPHLPLLVIGTLLYTSQAVFFSLMNAVLMGGITGAMLNLDFTALWMAGLQAVGLFALFIALLWPGILMYVAGELKTKRRLQTKMLRAFMASGTEDRVHSGERLSAMNTDAGLAVSLCADALASVLFCLIPIVVLSITVFAMEWRLGVYAFFAGLFFLLGQGLLAEPMAG
ncbi:MAG: hypothetical protein FWG93_04405, partial [Oscillospiraceae bacterium]|nr:hypothetical protein [Oscillospiraceae bacterium]